MPLSKRDKIRLSDLRAEPDRRRAQLRLLIKEHQYLIYKALKEHKLSLQELEELYQDTLLTFVEKVDRQVFRGDSSISTFISGIFFNKIANTFKKKETLKRGPEEKVVYELEEKMSITNPGVMKQYDSEDVKQRTDYYLSLLDKKCREVLILSIYREFDMEEIASRLGWKSGGVARVNKHKCLKRLKKIIQEREIEV